MNRESGNNTRPLLEAELAEWQSYVGRQKLQRVVVDAEALRRFALAAGIAPDVERQVPLLSHWALFLDAVGDERIGTDGHPERGDFLPDIHLPRRMFAAAELDFERPLTLAGQAECVSTIESVVHKLGSSGDLVFVKVLREVSQADQLCTREVQTLVYRPDGDPIAPVAEHQPEEGELWTPGPVQLFRFSAVTFNSHRIHYDLPYAQQQEGYPGLVVHGPFTALKLLDYAQRQFPDKAVRHFSFRGVAPLFVSQPVCLTAGETSDSFIARRCDGTIAMTAQVR